MSEEADQSEKTEDPSHKRLEDAHQKGDVPKSQELSSAFVLLGGTLVVGLMIGPAMANLTPMFANMMQQAALIPVDGGAIVDLTGALRPGDCAGCCRAVPVSDGDGRARQRRAAPPGAVGGADHAETLQDFTDRWVQAAVFQRKPDELRQRPAEDLPHQRADGAHPVAAPG
jgi:hypothetical protein